MQNELQGDLYEATLNEEGQGALTGVSQWAQIAAMVGLISLAINIVVLVIDIVRMATPGAASAVFGTLITTAISLLLNLTLLAAAQKIKSGLDHADQEQFLMGLGKLTTYFKILGILTIIAIIIFGLAAVVFAIFAGSSVKFS